MEQILSRENPLVKKFVKLRDSKSERDQTGLFVTEGIKICLEALDAGVSAEYVFVTQELLEKDSRVSQRVLNGQKAFIISDSVAKKLSDAKTPQGIFCICKKLDKDFDLCTIEKSNLFLMLCGISDPGNMGTIIRTADGLGAGGVIITQGSCDIYSPKVVRSAMGSISRMKIKHVADEREFISSLPETINTVAAVLDEKAISPDKLPKGRPTLLVIGNEAKGLSMETAAACRYKTMIPMKGGAESFNAAVAAAILMWELSK